MDIVEVIQKNPLNGDKIQVNSSSNSVLTVSADINVTKEHIEIELNNKDSAHGHSNHKLKSNVKLVKEIKENETSASNKVKDDVEYIQILHPDNLEDEGSGRQPAKDPDEILNLTQLSKTEVDDNTETKSYNRFEMFETVDDGIERSVFVSYCVAVGVAILLYVSVLVSSLVCAQFNQKGKKLTMELISKLLLSLSLLPSFLKKGDRKHAFFIFTSKNKGRLF